MFPSKRDTWFFTTTETMILCDVKHAGNFLTVNSPKISITRRPREEKDRKKSFRIIRSSLKKFYGRKILLELPKATCWHVPQPLQTPRVTDVRILRREIHRKFKGKEKSFENNVSKCFAKVGKYKNIRGKTRLSKISITHRPHEESNGKKSFGIIRSRLRKSDGSRNFVKIGKSDVVARNLVTSNNSIESIIGRLKKFRENCEK